MCYEDKDRPPLPPGAAGNARGDEIVLAASDGNRFAAYVANPDRPASAQVLIFPDVRGLHGFYKDLALRFAEQGITALALDYFGRSAGLGPRDDSFEYMPHVQQLRFDALSADVTAALDHLRSTSSGPHPAFIVGFCMGGSLALLTATRDVGLAGVIGFYAGLDRDRAGAGSVLNHAAEIKYPVLALFGGADQSIPADQVQQFDGALDRAGVEHQVVTYPGAPHSFFDRRADEFADASANAWRRMLDFIAAHTQ